MSGLGVGPVRPDPALPPERPPPPAVRSQALGDIPRGPPPPARSSRALLKATGNIAEGPLPQLLNRASSLPLQTVGVRSSKRRSPAASNIHAPEVKQPIQNAIKVAQERLIDLEARMNAEGTVKNAKKLTEEDYAKALQDMHFLVESGTAQYGGNKSVFTLRNTMLAKKQAKLAYAKQLNSSKERIAQQFSEAKEIFKKRSIFSFKAKEYSLNAIILCEELAMKKQLADRLWPVEEKTLSSNNKNFSDDFLQKEKAFQEEAARVITPFTFEKNKLDVFGHLARGKKISKLEEAVFRTVYTDIVKTSKECNNVNDIKKCIKAQFSARPIYKKIAIINPTYIYAIFTDALNGRSLFLTLNAPDERTRQYSSIRSGRGGW
jgi:hypothetical protein